VDADLILRDRRCVSCGAAQCRRHHRILGNTSDNRLSNRLALCGWGNVPPGCHGGAHQAGRLARTLGYIVTRHGPRTATLDVPVFYYQPAAGTLPGRIGWFTLDDAGELAPVDLPMPDERITP
jgi:hypothetical protein